MAKKSAKKPVNLSLRREHFRGVIWPRESVKGPEGKIYRYPIVGMLLSDHPIEMFEGKNEIVLDGDVHGMSDILEVAPRGKARYALGTADNVLCSLDHCIEGNIGD